MPSLLINGKINFPIYSQLAIIAQNGSFVKGTYPLLANFSQKMTETNHYFRR